MLGQLLRSLFAARSSAPPKAGIVAMTEAELALMRGSAIAGGTHYQQLLRELHGHLAPATYLEIGVSTGDTLRLAGPRTRAIGVDPEPTLSKPLGALQRVVQATSDDFFARHDARAELGGEVELAFIDGLHHFEFALRDFINVERLARPDSVVVMHDCWPLDERTSRRKRESVLWTGDVWRVVVMLRRHRPDLVVRTLGAPPSGLAVVLNLDPASTLLASRYEAIVAEGMALDYAWLQPSQAEQLALVPGDWSTLRALLDARPARR